MKFNFKLYFLEILVGSRMPKSGKNIVPFLEHWEVFLCYFYLCNVHIYLNSNTFLEIVATNKHLRNYNKWGKKSLCIVTFYILGHFTPSLRLFTLTGCLSVLTSTMSKCIICRRIQNLHYLCKNVYRTI